MNLYVETVALPGVYRLTEVFHYRNLIFGFGVTFILLVSLLSIIPMKQITTESVTTESRRRAMTVARALAQANERVLKSGDLANFSTEFVLREEGIDDVFIVSKQGTIISPAERIGMAPRQAGFLRKVVQQDKSMVGEEGSQVVAAVPILAYDANLQQNVAKAYTVIVYNPGSLTFDDGRALGLFVQMLTLAMLMGAVMFYLLFKAIEYPFRKVNESLDQSMRDGSDSVVLAVKFPAAQDLVGNINSLLARANSGGQANGVVSGRGAKHGEYLNILQLIGYPGLLIDHERKVLKVNAAFEALTGLQPANIEGRDLSYLPDQALQKNIQELCGIGQGNAREIAKDELEFSGQVYQLNCQVLTTADGEVDCFLVSITPSEAESSGAA